MDAEDPYDISRFIRPRREVLLIRETRRFSLPRATERQPVKMISGPHEHQCRVCRQRFECLQITHCKKVSDDPDYANRPVCYRDECRKMSE